MLFRRSNAEPKDVLVLLEGALLLPIPVGWRQIALRDRLVVMATDVPGAEVKICAERIEDRSAVRNSDLARYISRGDALQLPGMEWDPNDGPAFLTDNDYRGTGPHFLLVHALLSEPWIYRIECAIPLRDAPTSSEFVKSLLKTEPVPTLMYGMLAGAILEAPTIDVPPSPLTGREQWIRANFFELRVPEHWTCWERRGGEGSTEFVLQDTCNDHWEAEFVIDSNWIDLGFTDAYSSSLLEIAESMANFLAEQDGRGDADDPAPDRRPRGAPTICDWREDESLVKSRRAIVSANRGRTVRLDKEYSVRQRRHGSGCRLVHFHMTYPQALRADRAFQATANRLWLSFLEGRFVDD